MNVIPRLTKRLLLPLAIATSSSHAVTLVFIAAGQSNMDGRADISGFSSAFQSPLNSVDYYYGNDPGGSNATPSNQTLTTIRGNTSETSSTGPVVSFAHYLDANSTDSFAVIKYANGGTGFTDGRWTGGGDATTTGDGLDYRRLQNVVTNGISALETANPSEDFQIAGFLWTQGERDVVQGSSTAAYETGLTNLISDVRLTYGSDLPFFFTKLSNSQTSISGNASFSNVRTAQENVDSSIANTFLIDTDGVSISGDNLHFDATGYTDIGESFGAAVVSSGIVSPVPEPNSAIIMSLAVSGFIICRRRR